MYNVVQKKLFLHLSLNNTYYYFTVNMFNNEANQLLVQKILSTNKIELNIL